MESVFYGVFIFAVAVIMGAANIPVGTPQRRQWYCWMTVLGVIEVLACGVSLWYS